MSETSDKGTTSNINNSNTNERDDDNRHGNVSYSLNGTEMDGVTRIEEMSKEIKLMKAKILLLERREAKLNQLEEENKIKDEYIYNLEKNVANIYQKIQYYEQRLIKCEDMTKQEPIEQQLEIHDNDDINIENDNVINDDNDDDINGSINESLITASGRNTVNLDTATVMLDGEAIKIHYYNINHKKEIEKELFRQKKVCYLTETHEEYHYVITNIEWFMDNINTILSRPCIINLQNIEILNIKSNIVISNNVEFKTNQRVALYFNEINITITNGAKVIMSYFDINGCRNSKDHLFTIKKESSLVFKGMINNSYVRYPFFKVKKRCTLKLENVIFENNWIDAVDREICIASEATSEVNINNCTFSNHHNEDYSCPSRIISAKGDLNIHSSTFKKNKSGTTESDFFSIISTGSADINIIDTFFHECSPINISNATQVAIRSCRFENFIPNSYVGCIELKNSSNIEFYNTFFLNNKCINGYAGCIFFEKNITDINITQCLFKNNEIRGDYIGNGGAIRFKSSSCFIRDSTFQGNKSTDGGAIYITQSVIQCQKCTFEKNLALGTGGAICCLSGKIVADENNNEFIDNKAESSRNVNYGKKV